MQIYKKYVKKWFGFQIVRYKGMKRNADLNAKFIDFEIRPVCSLIQGKYLSFE